MLANLYMNRFLKHWRTTGRGEAFRAHVISYADDWLMHGVRAAIPKASPLASAEFATIRQRLIKIGARVIEHIARLPDRALALPSPRRGIGLSEGPSVQTP